MIKNFTFERCIDLIKCFPSDGKKENLADLLGIVAALIEENREYTKSFYN
jgi:hypothetical protein